MALVYNLLFIESMRALNLLEASLLKASESTHEKIRSQVRANIRTKANMPRSEIASLESMPQNATPAPDTSFGLPMVLPLNGRSLELEFL
jgi:hypothetical protein